MSTRRQTMIQLGAAGASLLLPRADFPAAGEDSFQLGEWTGDSFAPMHAIRDGKWNRPLPTPERRVEVAVVGGGIAGLAVASMLDDLDLVLLEREAEPGGNAKSGSWRGVDYALGSAYFVDVSGPFGEFYERLGVVPSPVPGPTDRMLTGVPGSPDALEGALQKPFAELREHLAAVAASPDYPKIPIGDATAAALALDRISFLDYLKQQHVEPSLFGLIDAYCVFCPRRRRQRGFGLRRGQFLFRDRRSHLRLPWRQRRIGSDNGRPGVARWSRPACHRSGGVRRGAGRGRTGARRMV